jgi:hypothetical protein
MRQIKLTFVDQNHLNTLLQNELFKSEIHYLKPQILGGGTSIGLSDPIPEHSSYDTEVVVLTIFARAMKRLIFLESEHEILFMYPFANANKGGLVLGGTTIVLVEIQIT